MINQPTLNDLECLILWPKGSRGYDVEREMIADLLALCKDHGFGRVPQVAAAIEEIWRDPGMVEKYKRLKIGHEKMMEEAKKVIT